MLRIVAFLGAAGVLSLVASLDTPQVSPGGELYLNYCASCHGRTGEPTRAALATWPTIPALSDSAFLASRSDDSLATVMHEGVGKDMPGRKGKLTREQLLEIARYLRSLGAKAP